MAGGGSKNKVREWLRKRMAPRKKAAAAAGDGGDGADLALAASAPSSPGRKLLAAGGAAPSALRWRRKPCGSGNVVAALFQRVAYHLMWLVESVVVVAQLVFFFVRFGFRI
ncbi:unnamed protein product [Urochloa humidicola]